MDRSRLQDLLLEHLDQELDEGRSAQVEQFLAEEPAVREAFSEMQETLRLIRQHKALEEPSASVDQSILAMARQHAMEQQVSEAAKALPTEEGQGFSLAKLPFLAWLFQPAMRPVLGFAMITLIVTGTYLSLSPGDPLDQPTTLRKKHEVRSTKTLGGRGKRSLLPKRLADARKRPEAMPPGLRIGHGFGSASSAPKRRGGAAAVERPAVGKKRKLTARDRAPEKHGEHSVETRQSDGGARLPKAPKVRPLPKNDNPKAKTQDFRTRLARGERFYLFKQFDSAYSALHTAYKESQAPKSSATVLEQQRILFLLGASALHLNKDKEGYEHLRLLIQRSPKHKRAGVFAQLRTLASELKQAGRIPSLASLQRLFAFQQITPPRRAR